MSGSCPPAHVGLPCFGTRQWCWGVVLESLSLSSDFGFENSYMVRIPATYFHFFEKSVHFRQPQLVCMSTFWKTLKWHQSNTPLTFLHHFLGAKFYILLPCLDFLPVRISLFRHPVLWLMVCRPGALRRTQHSQTFEKSLDKSPLHDSTTRPSRRVAMESTLLESRRSCCCTCWVGLRQWKRSYVKNGERQKEQLVSRSSGEDDL